jgi:hypothetical protein
MEFEQFGRSAGSVEVDPETARKASLTVADRVDAGGGSRAEILEVLRMLGLASPVELAPVTDSWGLANSAKQNRRAKRNREAS